MTPTDRYTLLLKVLGHLGLKTKVAKALGVSKMYLSRRTLGRTEATDGDLLALADVAADLISEHCRANPTRDTASLETNWPAYSWLSRGGDAVTEALTALVPASPLRKLREQHGFTQEQAAKLIGVARTTLIYHERIETLAEGEFYERAKRAYGKA